MPAKVDTDREVTWDTRPLRKSGNSVVVSIPPEVLETAGLERGDTIELSAPFEGGKITVTKSDAGEE